jgi:hypothetical protein
MLAVARKPRIVLLSLAVVWSASALVSLIQLDVTALTGVYDTGHRQRLCMPMIDGFVTVDASSWLLDTSNQITTPALSARYTHSQNSEADGRQLGMHGGGIRWHALGSRQFNISTVCTTGLTSQ